MCKNVKLIIITVISVLLLIAFSCNSYATNLDYDVMELKEKIDSINLNDIKNSEDLKNYFSNKPDINEADIVEVYTELTEKFSNQDIANMIEENKEIILEKSKVDEKVLDTATTVLNSLDTETTKQILKEDLNIEEIKQKLDNGYTLNQVIQELEDELPVSKVASISFKLLFASRIVKTVLIVSFVLLIYRIMIRWIVLKKAGKHGWATLIPIYNEVTYLKVAGISPWWILINLIPVVGWVIYGIVEIVSRFTLAYSFKRGMGFGLGLVFLAIIFESVLAFSKNIKYVGLDEVEE